MYIIAGIIINPPPTPIIDAKTPTIKPINKGGSIEIYKPDFLNLILKGKPMIQE